MLHILCTRPIKKEFIEEASKQQIRIHTKNFIKIVPIISTALKTHILSQLKRPDIILLFTSKNAVSIAFENYLNQIPKEISGHWKCYVLSGATKKELLQYLEEDQIIAEADCADDLCKKIEKQRSSIHFFCSHRRRNTLPKFFKKKNLPFTEWEIYQTENNPHFIIKEYDAYLFYSPSAIDSFFTKNRISADKPCFTIGETTASTLREKVNNPIFISQQPDTHHLLQLIYHHFN